MIRLYIYPAGRIIANYTLKFEGYKVSIPDINVITLPYWWRAPAYHRIHVDLMRFVNKGDLPAFISRIDFEIRFFSRALKREVERTTTTSAIVTVPVGREAFWGYPPWQPLLLAGPYAEKGTLTIRAFDAELKLIAERTVPIEFHEWVWWRQWRD